MAPSLLFAALVRAQTSTTEVPRVVGDPLPTWVVLGASAALLAAIVVAGLLVRRRHDRRSGRPGS